MDFSLSVEQVATLPIWRHWAFVISVKHQLEMSISFPSICCSGIIPWMLHGLTCVWAPGAAHTRGTWAHPSGIDGLAPGLDIIVSFCQAHKPSIGKLSILIADKAFWERRETFLPVRGNKRTLFPVLWPVLGSEKQRTIWVSLLITPV